MNYLIYFFYFLVILLLSFYGDLHQLNLKKLTGIDYNPYKYLFFSSLLPIILGLLISLPEMWNKYKTKGKWSIDKQKLMAIGIPSFFVSFMPILIFVPISKYLIFGQLILMSQLTITVAGVLLGCTILSSFNKNED